ncbi:MAG: hypothetical protein WC175_02905 [Candidatus Dojkabacteria bacterium]
MKKFKNTQSNFEESEQDSTDIELFEDGSYDVLEKSTLDELVDIHTFFKDDKRNIEKEIREIDDLYREIKGDVDSARGINTSTTNMNAGGMTSKTKTRINGYITKQVENLISIKTLKFHLLQQGYNISKNMSELNLKQFLAMLRLNKDKDTKKSENLQALLELFLSNKSATQAPQDSVIPVGGVNEMEDLLDQRIEEENITYLEEDTAKKTTKKKKKFKVVYLESEDTILAVDNDYNIIPEVDLSDVVVVKIEDNYYNQNTGELIEVVEDEEDD